MDSHPLLSSPLLSSVIRIVYLYIIVYLSSILSNIPSSVSRTIRALTGSHSRHCVQPYRSLYTYYTLYLLMRRSSLTHSCSGRAHICIVHIFGMRACVRIRVRLSLRDVQQLVLELLVKRNHSYVCLYTYYVLRIAKWPRTVSLVALRQKARATLPCPSSWRIPTPDADECIDWL